MTGSSFDIDRLLQGYVAFVAHIPAILENDS